MFASTHDLIKFKAAPLRPLVLIWLVFKAPCQVMVNGQCLLLVVMSGGVYKPVLLHVFGYMLRHRLGHHLNIILVPSVIIL